MGIDGIGGGGTKPPGAGLPEAAAPAGKAFSVSAGDSVGKVEVQSAEAAAEATPAGDFVESRVEEAVRHLQGTVSPEQLEMIREQLREQIQSNPVFAQLVARAGRAASET